MNIQDKRLRLRNKPEMRDAATQTTPGRDEKRRAERRAERARIRAERKEKERVVAEALAEEMKKEESKEEENPMPMTIMSATMELEPKSPKS